MRAPPEPTAASSDERQAWVALAATDGLGPESHAALLAYFGGAMAVLAAAKTGALREWASAPREDDGRRPIASVVLERIEHADEEGAARAAQIAQRGLWAVTPLDVDYPAQLFELDPPPPLLVGDGDRALLSRPRQVAVVGTRRPTPAGRLLSARVAARLVEAGAVVVSGLAIGIDGAAHSATIERRGGTTAVIGGGHLHPGPRAHADLRRRILESGGAIVSEFPPHVRPSKGTYPRRNRIIAALCQATIVIEAPRRSGALITAHDALELGRTVLVAPGRIGDWSTAGSLALLHDTPARVLADLSTIADDLGFVAVPPPGAPPSGASNDLDAQARRGAALAMLDGPQRAVAERICRAPAGLDVLVDDTGLAPAVVSGAVTLLLMRGWLQPIGPAYLPAGPLLG